MARFVFLDADVMRSAVSVPLIDNGHEVSLVGRYQKGEIVEEVHHLAARAG